VGLKCKPEEPTGTARCTKDYKMTPEVTMFIDISTFVRIFHATIVSHTNTSIRHLSSNSFPQLFKEGLATIVRLKKLKKFQQVGSTAFLFVLVQC